MGQKCTKQNSNKEEEKIKGRGQNGKSALSQKGRPTKRKADCTKMLKRKKKMGEREHL